VSCRPGAHSLEGDSPSGLAQLAPVFVRELYWEVAL